MFHPGNQLLMQSRVIAYGLVTFLLPLTSGHLFGGSDICLIEGFCDNILGHKKESKQRQITFLLPEICHPNTNGLTRASPENATINMERDCPLGVDRRYRTIDGTCNNPFNLGASATPLSRVLSAKYEDGLEVPRTFAKNGQYLPGPRRISRVIHPDVKSTTRFTIYVMAWGQLMDHDLISTPLPVEDTRRTMRCCSEDRTHIRPDADPECMPIMFRPEDNFKGNCMEFVRSMPVKDYFGNVLKPREHMNVVTSFLDASTVYGSNVEREQEVRERNGTGYLLRVTPDDYLPDNGRDDCIKEKEGDYCFVAGDDRVNEHPALSLLHTVLVRLHNRLAHLLRYMRPLHSDDEIYQRTRHIVVAMVQKISFGDWLPIILGDAVKTRSLTTGYERTEYNSMIDPSVPSSFGAAVFRFGHTLIPRIMPFKDEKPLLRDVFFKPFKLINKVESLTEGLASALDLEARIQMPDAFIVEEVTNHLFETEEGLGQGFDLIALNIQRARDHGIPPYNDFREHCGLHRIKSLKDPALGISQKALAAVYNHPDDIDLFSGAMVEPLAYGGLVGSTFNCLISEVFFNIKYGDRFYFETKNQEGSFHDEELAEIRKVTLSQILCQTTSIKEIQLDVFRIPSKENPRVSCDWLVRQGLRVDVFTRYW